MSGENKGEAAQSKRPVDNDFQQQRLRAWQPLLTPPWVIVTFSVVGALFLILGIICLVETKKVVEYTSSTYEADDASLPVQTPVDIMVSEDMKAPVYMYYQLSNFYQNHRRYVKSRSDSQLRGESSPDTGNCDPLEKNGAGETYYPCGLIANSFFNDNFTVSIVGRAQPLSYDNNGIAWSSDKSDKFKARAPMGGETTISKENNVLPSVDNEDFIVWMRTAGLPTFKKLKYIIREDVPAGSTVRVNVWQNYKVKGFGGTKAVVLSTANWLGGRNTFLGIAYLVVGAICLVLALAFGAKHHFSPRPLGDMRYFNWPGVRASAAGRS